MTLANKVTTARFVLCVVYFALLAAGGRRPGAGLLAAVFVLFQFIAWSDLLDGYLARRYGQVTHFGRIADPLVDKILVCGSFIFFLTLDPLGEIFTAAFVVVVLGREFLVSGIRGAAEAAGIPFGATFWGKQKTLIQNITVGWALGYAAWLPGVRWVHAGTVALMWGTLAATVISGAVYVADARRLLRSGRV
jgi:CDP-diacylglycerol--glycerol-3-phosphate 3-phosphatidyltransferase